MANLKLTKIPANRKVSLQQWAKITIEKWEFNVANKNLIYSGDLINSFTSQISQDANNDIMLVTFAFQYYVRMLDMGVGRGVSKPEVKGSNRKVYKVFNKVFYSEFRRLIELSTEKFEEQAVFIISDNVTV